MIDLRHLKSLSWSGVVFVAFIGASEATGGDWPTWRGPEGTGVAEGNPPTTWSEAENIAWKVPLPGTGQSTPVIWGERLFVLTATSADEAAAPTRRPDSKEQPRGLGRRMTLEKPEADYDFNVVCLDANTGETLWTRTAATARPHEGHHQAGSYASYSAVTDWAYVWASFGSRGIHCFDVEGNHQWSQPLDPMTIKSNFGEGSSAALAGDVIVVVQDHEGPSKIRAFDKRTGALHWEKDRDESTSWATPAVVEVDGRLQVIVSATGRIRGYDAATGDVVWQCGGMTGNVIPSPIVRGNRVYCASGFFGSAMKAITLGREGELTGTDAVTWSLEEAAPYVPTPLLYGDRLYFVEDIKPYFSCVDVQTGEFIYTRERLPGLRQIYASPVGANGRIYISDRSGTTAVLAHSDTFEVLATNRLDDGFDASPVVVGDRLYLKGNTYLYCIE